SYRSLEAMRLYLGLLIAIAAWAAEDPYAAQLFQKHCARCHNSETAANARVPQVSVLKTMTTAAIQKTLESGVMKTQAAALSADERLRVATFLGTAVTLERKREEIPNLCQSNEQTSAGQRANLPAWAGWGAGLVNSRFQPAKNAGLDIQDLPRLTLKWAFA